MYLLKGSQSSIMLSFIYSLFSSSWNFDFGYFMSTLARPYSLFKVLPLASSNKELKTFNFYLSCLSTNFSVIYYSPELFCFAF